MLSKGRKVVWLSCLAFLYTGATNHNQDINLFIHNMCKDTKTFAIYQVSQGQMLLRSSKLPLAYDSNGTLRSSYKLEGVRLSSNGDWPLDMHWSSQSLFEYGYSTYAGLEGVAYDLSMIGDSQELVGIAVQPLENGRGSGECPAKICIPGECDPTRGWTHETQEAAGSPADTACFKGSTDFKVTYCPENLAAET